MIAHDLSCYGINYNVQKADEVIKRVFPNAEYYAEKFIFNELKVIAFIPGDENCDFEINGKKYCGVWTSPYSKLLDSYKKSRNKQISLFDMEG